MPVFLQATVWFFPTSRRTGASTPTPPRRPSFWRALLRALAAWGA